VRWSAVQLGPPPSALDRILGKSVPLWLVAAIILFSALGTVAFAWYVKRAVVVADESPLARAAIKIASFPTDAKEVFVEMGRLASGTQNYAHIRGFPPDKFQSEFSPVKSSVAGVGEGLVVRHGPGTPARGWRIIGGHLDVNGSQQNAAVLLSPDLEIVHYWPLVEDAPIGIEFEPAARKVLHGLAILRDGSIIYSFDNGMSLHRKDKCGRTLWGMPGQYHHTVTLDETESTAWVLRTDNVGVGDEPSESADPAGDVKLVQVQTADGSIVREFSIADIISANPEIDILELRRRHPPNIGGNHPGLTAEWLQDPIHMNDIDPLPSRLADKFPMFSPGDVLVSAREINLLFVMDPATLKVKWWQVGATIRQHDPDWQPDGTLSVFNNRMGRAYSEITKIDPVTRTPTVAVDGRAIDFYTRRRGSHQPLPDGGFLIASTQQGRIIEVSADGQLALDFQNRAKDERLAHTILSAGIFLPEGALKAGDFQCGEN
jgi:Arylsulfotransferase (ASST)